MNECNNKKLEYEIQNLMQLRNSCINSVPFLLTGTLGLLFLAFSYLKIILFVIGCFCLLFLIILINIIDTEIDKKIGELK